MDPRDSQLLLDLDKGGAELGPLFEEPRRRLQEDPGFRNAWSQYQAIRALAWETAPDLDERLVRQGLQSSRRQDVERRLARAAGSQDAARELLLDPGAAKRSGLPAWASFLLLLGASGLGWTVFGPEAKRPLDPSAPGFSNPEARVNSEAPLAFEFPEDKSAAESGGLGQPPAADETRAENPDARRARRLLLAHLHRNEPVVPPVEAAHQNDPSTGSPRLASPAPTHTAIAPPVIVLAPSDPPTVQATQAPTHAPTAAPTAASTVAPTAAPTALPTAIPTVTPLQAPSIELEPEEAVPPAPRPTLAPTSVVTAKALVPRKLEGMAVEASLTLSGSQFPAQATLSLPEAGAVDLRLFDMRGRLVRRYAEGERGPGRWRYSLNASNDQGQALAKGSYYLRVTAGGFSKVEALEQP